MKAMIFAAGLGTRLKPFTGHTPKALAPLGNTTLLAHNIQYLQKYGINDIIINVHHFPEQVEKYLHVHNNFGSNITISDERHELLETGGGLRKAMHFFHNEPDFLLMNVDIITSLDIAGFVAAHRAGQACATLAVMNRASSRELLFDAAHILCGWRNNVTGEQRNVIEQDVYYPKAFTGIQVLTPAIWENVPLSGKFSIIDLYLHRAKDKCIKAYDHSNDLFIDIGKPEALAIANELFGS